MLTKNYLSLSLLLCLTLFCASSCSMQADGCDISGKVEGNNYAQGIVYLKDVNGLSIIDSTRVTDGTFHLKCNTKDSVHAALLVLMSSPNDIFPSFLPVVIEAGKIKAFMGGNSICISGTPQNEKMQSFLEALDQYTTQSYQQPQSVAEARKGFIDFLEAQISQNKDNAVGQYIRRAYSSTFIMTDSISE